jgi:uncharacterized protein YceK
MHNSRWQLAFAVFLLATTGCGTMANLDGRRLALIDFTHQIEPMPFGGVGRDMTWICSGGLFFVVDLPFSLVGDIVTLPRVLWTMHAGYEIWDLQPLLPEENKPLLLRDRFPKDKGTPAGSETSNSPVSNPATASPG